MEQDEYIWCGDWEPPQQGQYTILCNDTKMDPGDVVRLLEDRQDLAEQLDEQLEANKSSLSPETLRQIEWLQQYWGEKEILWRCVERIYNQVVVGRGNDAEDS
jgi:hypothetical protein